MEIKCQHYNSCRNPVNTCNSECERSRCDEREFGDYNVTIRGRKYIAEFTKSGWKVPMSNWYENDSYLSVLGRVITELQQIQDETGE